MANCCQKSKLKNLISVFFQSFLTIAPRSDKSTMKIKKAPPLKYYS